MRPIYYETQLVGNAQQFDIEVQSLLRAAGLDGAEVAEALNCDALNTLKIELATRGVTGLQLLDTDTAKACHYAIEDNVCSINVSELAIGHYYVTIKAIYGTHTRVLCTIFFDVITEADEHTEPIVIQMPVVSTITPDMSGVALEATSQEIKAAIMPISDAAEAYNTGKVELAQNITSKGVQASATETLPELAEKVAQIPQETTIYEGADSYGKQLSADGVLWDLYQVLADMKTRFMGTGDYAALIVCEYYKGYPSLVLQGADGYYTCDGDYYDYASPNHIWHDDDNGKMNRWVAFLYRDEGARLDITNTAISPRSMYIGGHIGTIEYFVNGRLTSIVCGIEETDVLDNFLPKNFAQAWGKNIYIKVSNEISPNILITDAVFACLEFDKYIDTTHFGGVSAAYLVLKNKNAVNFTSGAYKYLVGVNNDKIGIVIEGDINNDYIYNTVVLTGNNSDTTLKFLYIKDFIEGKVFRANGSNSFFEALNDLMVGEKTIKFETVNWQPSYLSDAQQKEELVSNILNHILGIVPDRTGQSASQWKMNINMYNAIASEQIEWQGETMSLADAFLTKNWLLAGA